MKLENYYKMKKLFIHNLSLGALVAFYSFTSMAQEQTSPNLVFVFPDQMRGQAMGFLGEENVKTPVLDKFAGEGIYFTQAVSNYPVCSPTRAMLMTGQHPIRNKVLANCTSITAEFDCELQETARCWSDVLKEQGYSLGYIGKWHLDSPQEPFIPTYNNKGRVKWNDWCPPERRHGFDYWHAYGTYDRHLRPMYWDTHASRDSFKFYDEWGPAHEADRAIDFIRNEGNKFRVDGQPFALVVSMNPPHTDYNQVPDKYKKLYEDIPVESFINKPNIPSAGSRMGDYYRNNIKNYYACISGVDEQFGRILKALEEQNLTENTIVVFTSDHGDCMGIHEENHKNIYYEESMRIPLLIRYPAKLKPRYDDLLISTIDIYPTLLGLMAFNSIIPTEVEGQNFAGYLQNGKGKEPNSQWYLKIDNGIVDTGKRGIRTKRYTYVIIRNEDDVNEVVLFDRENDPYQLNNIAGKKPKLEKQLKKELMKWLKKFNDPYIKHLME